MKVGTDGVLLGAWTSVHNCKTILDVGTGTGLIALMLAQRCSALIDAIDIEYNACTQANENVASSSFGKQVRIHHQSFDKFAQTANRLQYDLIVSNPPYFITSLQSPDNKRTIARHSESLSFMDIIEKGRSLLSPTGRITLIVPFEQGEILSDFITEKQMVIIKRVDVYPTPAGNPRRILVELSMSQSLSCSCFHDKLIVEESRHRYTAEFQNLTHDYYL
jgi:tRNA1Val (adenine37-N6)-methyltransferase